MPQLNKEKLNNYMQAVQRAIGRLSPEQIQTLRIELSPFCMEMTDEEIYKEGDKRSNFMEDWSPYERGFNDGAKFVRDGK